MAGYPSFAPLFSSGRTTTAPLYLELLNLTAGAGESLRAVRRALALSAASRDAEIVALLRDPDWRAHLVGGVAVLLDGAGDARLAALWWAIDGVSWVTPQLVAVAARVDASFALRARERVDRECAASPAARSPRLLSALVHFVENGSGGRAWLAEPGPREVVPRLIVEDESRSGALAARWDEGITALLGA